MKVNIEIDCSPEEARRFMGLPDVEQANAVYVDSIARAMKGVSNTEQLEQYARQLAPMGQMGLKMFQNFMENAAKTTTAGAGSGVSKDKDKPNRD
ncbi:DUF6489 family protein [Aurantiacibacter poecillastricola]|uniref:DUF6489 family protein n=1 Tax=Aurantiacibacter poecillastricola TaxID=3064385 RepID=UPI00273E4EC8|nr:DUF6489 family protein [Aurantiacibacter sp. 219JJ12-13]MDP5260502.1 DUF6489 family protein [Aurantiacibacter sp. 219JJ12-13]